jgi:quinol monooxygenase YgiN
MDAMTGKRREEILEEMRQISRMRRGCLSRQHYRVGQGKNQRRQGPYHILQGWQDGEHWSARVSKDELEQVREDVKAYERYQALCQEFAELTEKAADAEADSKKNDRRLERTVSTRQTLS